MNECLSVKRERYVKRGQSVQPGIFNVADEVFYVIYDQVTYKLPTIVKAVDTSVKLHSVLNIKYDPECEGIYTFIQRYFYGIETPYDKVSPSCAILLKKCEMLRKY